MHPRRWRERLRQAAEAEGQRANASVRRGARDARARAPHPAGLPGRAALLAAGYRCTEDLPDPACEGRDDAEAELSRVELVAADADSDADIDSILSTLGFAPEED